MPHPLGGRLAALVATVLLVWAKPGAGAPVQVDLELVLAVDISRSMDYDELQLQRAGYAAAFRHPEVINAIRGGGVGRIAVAYVEWAGIGLARLTIPWTLIDGEATAEAFAQRIEAAPILPASRTSISGGLEFAAALFPGSGFQGVRRVIDVSGDGPNNQGPPVESVRDRVVAEGITINGLPILLKSSTPSGWYDIRELDRYYEDCVIGGFGAFLIPVTEEVGFATAVRRKLVLEISAAKPRVVPAQVIIQGGRTDREKVDCLIGEKLWQRRWEN